MKGGEEGGREEEGGSRYCDANHIQGWRGHFGSKKSLTLKPVKPPYKGQSKSTVACIWTLFKITSKRGQPLYKGSNAGSQACPLY